MYKLYAIYDRVADDIFGGIIRVQNDEVARRNFHDALANPQSPFKGHEGDYELLYLGNLNNRGFITSTEGMSTIARGADWLAANASTSTTEIVK